MMPSKRVWLVMVAGASLALGARASTNVFEMPLIFPQHRQLQQQLVLSMRAGKIDEMESVCREGVALMPQDPTWQYNLACALAYRADKKRALDALDRAIDLGFRNAQSIREDNDLKQLSGQPAFQALLEKAARLEGKPVAGVVTVQPLTVLMGLPAEINATNTLWDFDVGCFRTLLTLIRPDLKRLSGYAGAYNGPAAMELRAWFREDSASGNFGDLYVNRDGGHSPLAVTNFPGLTPVAYCAEAQKHRTHLGLPNTMFEQPLIGNSSMSMVAGPFWRSLPRAIVADPFQPISALQFYVSNQCWFYPEHRDFDSDKGDLFPANTPYYVVSQGSSYSDQPFMEAFAASLAAFRPATKQALVARKLVAPTLQMIFRATQKCVRRPEDYLTGVAHPVVFDKVNLDAVAMARMAHTMLPDEIPPLVMLRTVEDAKAEVGVDFFDTRPEGLFDTPCCIARVVRGVARERKMKLEASAPGMERAASFRWAVLQGDPAKVTIRPLTPNASQVEVTVSYHGLYRPKDASGQPAALLSGRVDLGCFVKAGAYYSAPSFVSFYYLPNEERVYRDDGLIQSVDYTNQAHRYADPALTLEKGWKDLYDYDAAGHCTGWFRMRGGQSERFTRLGHKVLECDKANRPIQACAVQYLPRQTGMEGAPPVLSCVELPQRYAYRYANADDKVGVAEPAK